MATKGHTYSNKPAACSLFKYVWPFVTIRHLKFTPVRLGHFFCCYWSCLANYTHILSFAHYVYENSRMKIKDRVLSFKHSRFPWFCFSSVYKGYHFVLLIWRCLGIKYGDDVILRTHYFTRFCDLSLYRAKVWIDLWNNLRKIFLVIYFLE